MTRGELAGLLMGPFGADTADRTARRVCAEDGDGAVGELYRLATQPDEGLPRPLRRRVLFRGAWVLERIYFGAHDRFMPHAGSFCRRDFAAASDPGRRRLFAKIMADLLVREEGLCGGEELGRIAEAAMQWAVDPAMPVSVKVWTLGLLRTCRGRVGWVADAWDDLTETLGRDAAPGLACRLRGCTAGEAAGTEVALRSRNGGK